MIVSVYQSAKKGLCEWNRPKRLAYKDELECSVTNGGHRNLTIVRTAKNCCHLFAINNDLQRQVRNDHDLTCNSTDREKNTVTTSKKQPYQFPFTVYNKTYRAAGWWTSHMKVVHKQCAVIDGVCPAQSHMCSFQPRLMSF